MNPKTLFNIIIKVFGLLIAKEGIDTLAQFLQSIVGYNSDFGISLVLFSVLPLFIYIPLVYYCIFKTNYILDKLKLADDMPEAISINIDTGTILYCAIIVTGGLILIDQIPHLIQSLYGYYQEGQRELGYSQVSTKYITASITKVIIAIILLNYSKILVNFIERKRK